MAEPSWHPAPAAGSVAVIGLACRFPDADDPPTLLDTILTGRRAFRRVPPSRLDLSDYDSVDATAWPASPTTPAITAGAHDLSHLGPTPPGTAPPGITAHGITTLGPAVLGTATLGSTALDPTALGGALDPAALYAALGATADGAAALAGDGRAGGGARAGLLEGWQFDREAFRISAQVYAATDPAHWLALETAARALAAAGFPGGTGLDRDRIGVIVGSTPAADASRATALRLRWPFVRRVLAESLFASGVRADRARKVIRHAAARYLAPLPRIGEHALAGGLPVTIPARISSYFGFRGGSQAVDSACASSLQAIASACAALTARDVDVALAGGVDVSLDPLELIGLARAGGGADVRIYDENPTGYLPGEGCGVVVLMRTAQARAAGLPVYAEIIGWGTSSGGMPGVVASDASSQLLALQRAYERAGVDPCEVQLFEGNGSGTPGEDEAELTALTQLRADAREAAALGSIKANIGHAKAAAGVAGLIKTVLALSTGVIPPTTGVLRPHPLLTGADAAYWLPEVPEEWPGGNRLAGVSAMGVGGVNVHLVLRNAPGRGSRYDRVLRVLPRLARAGSGKERAACTVRASSADRPPAAYLLHAPDRQRLAAALTRVGEVAGWLSDAEMMDLSCQLGRDARSQGPARVAIVASHQEELARLAREAVGLLPGLHDGLITMRPGIFAAENADGRVTLLLSDEADPSESDAAMLAATRPADGRPADGRPVDGRPAGRRAGTRSAATGLVSPPAAVSRPLAALRWLESLDVSATAAVGHGLGEIAGLAWAGVLSEADVTEIAALRAEFLSGPSVRVLPSAGRHARGTREAQPESSDTLSLLRDAVAQFRFGPPRRRLISTRTGRELASSGEVIDLICGGFAGGDRLAEALAVGAQGATLLVETGPARRLAAAATRVCRVPAIGLDGGADRAARVWTGAALFAAGAIGQIQPLFAGQPARPIDIWRDQVFITGPGQAAAGPPDPALALDPPESGPARRLRPRPTLEAPVQVAAPRTAPHESLAEPGPVEASTVEASTVEASTVEASTEPAARAAVPAPRSAEAAGPAADTDTDTAAAADDDADQPATADSVAGVAAWARCFAEELRPSAQSAQPADDRPWRIRVAGSYPFREEVRSVFEVDPDADRSLAVIGDPAAPGALLAALLAAQDGLATGRLTAIATGPGLTGFLATVHAEHPELGITVLRVPATAAGLAAARPFAAAQPGEFRELVIAADGSVREPVLAVADLPGGQFPLGPQDVALVSRSSGGAALALAQVLACCGAAIAVVGQAGPDGDREVVAGLEQLRLAGVRVAYEMVDSTDPLDMALAVQRVERRLGPVTAVAHAVSPGAAVPVADLTQQDLLAHLGAGRAALHDLLSAVKTERLRLVLTFGSVAGRYGLPGEALLAAASTALAGQGAALAAGVLGCRAVHVELPGWSGDGLGERPDLAERMVAVGAAPIAVGDAARLLLKMLGTPEPPGLVAVHGRIGGPGPADGGAPDPAAVQAAAVQAAAGRDGQLAGRFLQDVRVHYPGIELVCDARLSLATDPYLADYRADGLPVLPPAMALEALAQAASALAGRPLRQASGIRFEAPVLLPATGGPARIRVCALATGATITAVLRCAESGFDVDHVRAEFRLDEAPTEDKAGPGLASPEVAPAALLPGATGLVDGAELYGPVCFQSGRFRRIAILAELTARSCRALARGAEDGGWFGSARPETAGPEGLAVGATGRATGAGEAAGPGEGLLLGSPGLNDAVLQVLQACVPHRRVWLASCKSVSFSGEAADGAVEIRAAAAAVRDPSTPTVRPAPAAGVGVPAQAQSPDQPLTRPHELAWDVEMIDSGGRVLATWRGVRLRETGLLPRNAAWPPALLSVYLERGAAALGLDAGLRVTVQCGQPAVPVPQQRSGEGDGAVVGGTGQLTGFTLDVRAARFAACGWAAADPQRTAPATGGAEQPAAGERLCGQLAEPPTATVARLEAVAACLAMAQGPESAPVTLERATGDGWALLSVADTRVACVVVEISGVSCPVAIAIATAPPSQDGAAAQDGRGRAGHARGRRAAARH